MIIRRITAYIIDILIVSVITAFVYTMPFFGNTQEEYLESYNEYLSEYTTYMENPTNEDKLLDSEYKMVKSSSTLLIVEIGVTIIYFSIIPFFTKGKTLGKKITKLQVVSNNSKPLNPGLFFLRGLLNSMIIIDIINMFVLLIGNKSIWIDVTTVTSIISTILYITMFEFMVIRKDRRSLHDIIANTKVIDVSNKQKTLNA